MSQEVFIRGLFSGFISLAFAWVVFSRNDRELGSENTGMEGQRYLPYISGALLPGFLLGITILGIFDSGVSETVHFVLSMCFSIFLQICLYYLALLLALPFLRKFISARSCAMLWMLPNFLYYASNAFMELPSPLLVITTPGKLLWVLALVWFVGFGGVLLWKIIDHLAFRRRVLTDAVPVTDPDVLRVWQETVEDARIRKPKFKLMVSPSISTPLTVGLFQRSTRVLLPERSYSREELVLILRHEIVHIGREDAWSKFFMVFCTAMCWFNPLMWVAMRKSAEDLELSCDETVLLDADEATRKQYALLLLDTAGDSRGFTTCLSASVNAMRYRLRSITKPAKRRSGALIVGAVFFLLCMTSGYVALAYDCDSGANLIYQYGSDYQIRHITLSGDDFNRRFAVSDEAAVHDYLSGLTLYKLSGSYSYSDSETSFTYLMDMPAGTLGLVLSDHAVKTVPLYQLEPETAHYYVPEGIDWDYLSTVIFEYPAMNVHLTQEGDAYGKDLKTIVTALWRITDGDRVLLHQEEYPQGEYHGLFTRVLFPSSAAFTCTYKLAAPLTVLVESWDYSERYTVTATDLDGEYVIALPNYPAHYTVYASIYDKNGNLYDAEFWFNIGQVNSN